jgi:VWFA-related protein
MAVRKSLCGIVVLLIAAGVFSQTQTSTPPPAQNQPAQTPPAALTVQSNTRLVVVDVIATDNKGQVVSDLKQEDFRVLEDGRPQELSHFAFRSVGQITPVTQKLAPNVFTNAPQYQHASSLDVILLDAINGEFTSRAYAQDRLLKFFDGNPTLQPTAIFALETKLTMIHDFSTDAKALRLALAGFKGAHEAPRMQDPYLAASPFATHGDAHTSETNVENTLLELKLLAQILSGYAGRKNVIWLSEAFPQTFFEDGITTPNIAAFARSMHGDGRQFEPPEQAQEDAIADSHQIADVGPGNDFQREVSKVMDALMEAHVALYPVDSASLGHSNRLASQRTMTLMAAGTGGRTFINRNDLETGVRTSLDDGSSYYTLSYYPANKTWNGRFRAISVTTTRPGISLRYRLGYYALDPKIEGEAERKRMVEEFGRALSLNSPDVTGVLFQAKVDTPAEKTSGDTQIAFSVSTATLSFTPASDGRRSAEFACATMAYTAKNVVAKQEISSVRATLTPEEFARVDRGVVACHNKLALKSGTYMLKFGVVDASSGLMGTTSAKVVVP